MILMSKWLTSSKETYIYIYIYLVDMSGIHLSCQAKEEMSEDETAGHTGLSRAVFKIHAQDGRSLDRSI
jgi:hypothetical protein